MIACAVLVTLPATLLVGGPSLAEEMAKAPGVIAVGRGVIIPRLQIFRRYLRCSLSHVWLKNQLL